MRRRVRVPGPATAALALVALAAVAVAACGSPAPAGWQTFGNPQYRFSIAYDAGHFTPKAPIDAKIKKGTTSAYGVGFIPHEAPSGGNVLSLYVVQVTTYKSAWTAKKVASLKPYFTKSVANMTATLGAKVSGPVRETIAGAPAWSIQGTLTTGGTPIHMRIHYVFRGSDEYELVEQATAADWPAGPPTRPSSAG